VCSSVQGSSLCASENCWRRRVRWEQQAGNLSLCLELHVLRPRAGEAEAVGIRLAAFAPKLRVSRALVSMEVGDVTWSEARGLEVAVLAVLGPGRVTEGTKRPAEVGTECFAGPGCVCSLPSVRSEVQNLCVSRGKWILCKIYSALPICCDISRVCFWCVVSSLSSLGEITSCFWSSGPLSQGMMLCYCRAALHGARYQHFCVSCGLRDSFGGATVSGGGRKRAFC